MEHIRAAEKLAELFNRLKTEGDSKYILKEDTEISEDILNVPKHMKYKQYSFLIPEEIKSKILISVSPISISKFTYNLNELLDKRTHKKIKATDFTSWLVAFDYLKLGEDKLNNFTKIYTEKGESIGIFSEIKTNSYGRKYCVNLYNESAQQFLVDNLDKILIWVDNSKY